MVHKCQKANAEANGQKTARIGKASCCDGRAGGGGVAVPEMVPGRIVQIPGPNAQMPGSKAPGAEGGTQAMHAPYHQADQLHGQPPDGQPQLVRMFVWKSLHL